MKITQTLKYSVDAHLVRDDTHVHIVLTGIESDGDKFHSCEWDEVVKHQDGYDGIDGYVLDSIELQFLPEDLSDDEILDQYFNSPYGVA